MADITIKAAYGSVVEDEGFLFIGFAEGEEEDEGYVLFRQPMEGGPVGFEVNDEGFGAEEAVDRVTAGPPGIENAVKPDLAEKVGRWEPLPEKDLFAAMTDIARSLRA